MIFSLIFFIFLTYLLSSLPCFCLLLIFKLFEKYKNLKSSRLNLDLKWSTVFLKCYEKSVICKNIIKVVTHLDINFFYGTNRHNFVH